MIWEEVLKEAGYPTKPFSYHWHSAWKALVEVLVDEHLIQRLESSKRKSYADLKRRLSRHFRRKILNLTRCSFHHSKTSPAIRELVPQHELNIADSSLRGTPVRVAYETRDTDGTRINVIRRVHFSFDGRRSFRLNERECIMIYFVTHAAGGKAFNSLR
ncbi:hypothetical protein SPFM12_00199 [Salmonella phage SPFM12]|nr:hypothetical protein SPFM12_00199 [Salmonella phage SPFM12]